MDNSGYGVVMATSVAKRVDEERSVFDTDGDDSQGYSQVFNANRISQAGENRERRDREDAQIQLAAARSSAVALQLELNQMGTGDTGEERSVSAAVADMLVACGVDPNDPMIVEMRAGSSVAYGNLFGDNDYGAGSAGYGYTGGARARNFDGSFQTAASMFLGFEGGYANHARDNGGETIMGITRRYFPQEFATVRNLAASGQTQQAAAYATQFYREHFWNPIVQYVDSHYGNLDPRSRQALYLAGFDMACHSGIDTAEAYLRRSGGDVMAMIADRRAFLNRHEDADVFGRGWNNRLNTLTATIQHFRAAPAPAFAA